MQHRRPAGPNNLCALHISNLDPNTTEQELYEYFYGYGYELKSTRVILDQQGRSKRYGYLNFNNPHEADRCLNECRDRHSIGGRQVFLNRPREFKQNYSQMPMQQQQYQQPRPPVAMP